MGPFRPYCGIFLFAILLAGLASPLAASPAKPAAGKKEEEEKSAGRCEGLFMGLGQGSEESFVMSDAKKKESRFLILHPDPSVDAVVDKPERFLGRLCRVYWVTPPTMPWKNTVRQIVHVEWLRK